MSHNGQFFMFTISALLPEGGFHISTHLAVSSTVNCSSHYAIDLNSIFFAEPGIIRAYRRSSSSIEYYVVAVALSDQIVNELPSGRNPDSTQ